MACERTFARLNYDRITENAFSSKFGPSIIISTSLQNAIENSRERDVNGVRLTTTVIIMNQL